METRTWRGFVDCVFVSFVLFCFDIIFFFFFFFLFPSLTGFRFKFEEYEAISGAESVQIPSFYSGTIKNSGKTIEGKTVSGGDDENEDEANENDAKFKIDLVENDGAYS
jgi:hypothetical protein